MGTVIAAIGNGEEGINGEIQLFKERAGVVSAACTYTFLVGNTEIIAGNKQPSITLKADKDKKSQCNINPLGTVFHKTIGESTLNTTGNTVGFAGTTAGTNRFMTTSAHIGKLGVKSNRVYGFNYCCGQICVSGKSYIARTVAIFGGENIGAYL